MAISAKIVMELRKKTQVGMMECKKALAEANGDMELAEEILLKSGAAKAEKKSDRVANEGLLFVSQANDNSAVAVVEINCETDFVARSDDFQSFGNKLAELALKHNSQNIDSLLELSYTDSQTVAEMRAVMVAKLGENIQLRRAYTLQAETGCVACYSHGGRVVTLVNVSSDKIEAAKDIAMHIAAMKPSAISAAGIPDTVIAKEREIFTAQVAESGKPEHIAAKIIEGKVNKFMDENSLLGQAFVKEPKQKVGDFLKQHSIEVLAFTLYEIGMSGNDGAITV
ncbi:MAG: translation elongation factor Ts [Pseudomonadota bacterium]|nr:translation elongation factor Ts [Pseudomonadota bacterium]